MAKHYCDGCDSKSKYDEDRCDPEDDLCCGGDGYCPAVDPEPNCVDPEGHNWSPKWVGGNGSVWSAGVTSRRQCRKCGVVQAETTYNWQRSAGQCDEVRYEYPLEDDEDDED
jgi:hypothetical protein